MDWAKQSEEMMKTWTDTQKKMWDNWLDMVQKSTGQSQVAEVWQKTIEMWEKAVKSGLETQTELTNSWVENLSGLEGVSDEVIEWAKQAQDMGKQWNETQQELWQGWFDMVKKADATKMAGAWGEESQNVIKTWQESAQKMMDAQKQWANAQTAEKVNNKK